MIKKINLKDVAVSFFFSLIGVLLLKAYCDAVENQELSMLLKYTFIMSNKKLQQYVDSGDMSFIAEKRGFYFYKMNGTSAAGID